MRKLEKEFTRIYDLRYTQLLESWKIGCDRIEEQGIGSASTLDHADSLYRAVALRDRKLVERMKELNEDFLKVNSILRKSFWFRILNQVTVREVLEKFILKWGNHMPGWQDLPSS